MRRRIAGAALLALALAGPVAAEQRGWRSLLTIQDGKRLRDWRIAWGKALAEARDGGGAAAIAADPALFAVDAGLVDRVVPLAGDYRCRRVAIGARPGGPALTIGSWSRCRIDADAPRLVQLDGNQRVAGLIYADTDRRAIYLGTVMFGDGQRLVPYGHAAGRDQAGVVERIGERRWRLAVPFPHFGGSLDLVELAA